MTNWVQHAHSQWKMHSQCRDQAGNTPFSILQFGSQQNFYTPLRAVIQAVALPLLLDIPHSLNGFGSECALRYLKLTL